MKPIDRLCMKPSATVEADPTLRSIWYKMAELMSNSDKSAAETVLIFKSALDRGYKSDMTVEQLCTVITTLQEVERRQTGIAAFIQQKLASL